MACWCRSRRERPEADGDNLASPIEVAEGSKLIMTSGGYRTVTSRATVARFRKHVSPLTGVVTLTGVENTLPILSNTALR